MSNLFKVRFSDKHIYYEVYRWCDANCIDAFYPGNDWDNWEIGKGNRMVEFTSQIDATLFTLKWG